MQQQPIATPYPISDFLEWDASRQLVLTPKFQRRDIWIPKAKSYLIDSILRSMPIPPLFIWLIIDPIQKRSVREVIDGQQRLRSVFGFIKGDFPVLRSQNEEFGGMYYVDLPEDVQRKFLGYKFSVNVLQDISDSDVLGIFSRMNSYTEPLVAQELRNAQFFGPFKQTIYNLAHQHYAFWRNNGILSDAKISRMHDAEMVSELVVSMIDGIRQTKSKDLNSFYKLYDDEFLQAAKVSAEFEETINLIGNIFGDKLSRSPFKRIPLFYTLFCTIYDARFGLPDSKRQRLTFNARQIRVISSGLKEIEGALSAKDPSERYREFVEYSKLSTADVGKRKYRHAFIWAEVLQKAAD